MMTLSNQQRLEASALAIAPDQRQAATLLLSAATNLFAAEFGDEFAIPLMLEILNSASSGIGASHAH